MKKLALVTLAAMAAPAFAFAQAAAPAAEPAPVPAPAAPAPELAVPADPANPVDVMTPPATTVATSKIELKDGSWAEVKGDSVSVSKDGGATWTPAPDGTWEAKDGAKITTKGGKAVK